MTKCSVLPRGLGTFPAGSAVRVKSRFALYSRSGAALAAGVEVRFAAADFALRFVFEPVVRSALFRVLRLAVVAALRCAPCAPFAAPRRAVVAWLRFAAAFLPRAGRVFL